MNFRVGLLLGSVLAVSSFASDAFAQNLQAAVIGNSAYDVAPLANAARDAATIAESLASAGFEVRTYFDIEANDVDAMLGEIALQFAQSDISLLYYAGHAFQYDGQNQLLATDLDALTREEIEAKSFSLSDVLSTIELESQGSGGLRLVMIDACRDDPFTAVDDAFSRGISFEESGQTETLIAYSTSAGDLALDGPKGGNGPYAVALTRALQQGDPTISRVLRSVRRDVRVATSGLQIPWVVGSIETDPKLRSTDQFDRLAEEDNAESEELDEIVWQFVRNDLTELTLAQYSRNFPNSRFASLADERVRQIQEDRQASRGIEPTAPGAPSRETLLQLAQARQEIDADTGYQPSTNVPAELFRIWPDQLPPTAAGLSTLVSRCDILAADPADPQRLAPPIRDGLVNVREAARACGFALAQDPENPRLLFQFGRVLQIAGRHDWARGYYRRAAALDYSAALTNLGFMAIRGIGQDKDLDLAAEFYRQAAELGNLRARTNLGTMYLRGQGLPESPQEGILWYRLASAMGWPNAQNALADAYRRGVGVEKDQEASFALYSLAAANGQRAAMNNLGRAYLNGNGINEDPVRARDWFERSIAEGDRFAPRNLARHLLSVREDGSDDELILSLLNLSADRGERRAYLDLAQAYRQGKIVDADTEQAYFFAKIAELGEVDRAAELVAELVGKLSAETIDRIDGEIALRRRLNGI